MQIEKGVINKTQLLFAVVCFVEGAVLLTSFVVSETKQDTWLVLILGYFAAFPTILMYRSLSKKFPGKNIIEILEAVFGKVAGKIFGFAYLFFFLTLGALNTRDLGNFIVDAIMPLTPPSAVLIMFMFICIWAVRSGMDNMLRYASLIVVIGMTTLTLSSLFLIREMKTEYFYPMLNQPLFDYIHGVHVAATIPYGEVVVFFMLTPRLSDQKQAGRAIFGGLSIGGIVMLMRVSRDILVLGPAASELSLPSFQAVRLINVAGIFTRMELLYAVPLILLLFFKVSVLLYCCVLTMAQIFNLRTYRPLAAPTAAIILIYSLVAFSSSIQNEYFGPNIAPIFHLFFQIILPGLMLIAVLLRKLFKKNEVMQ